MWLLWIPLSLLPLVTPCDLLLAPSGVPGAGMGLFAGRDFAAEEILAVDESLLIKMDDCYGSQLNNYIFGTDDDSYANLNLGVITLMNHQLPKNTQGYLAAIASPDMVVPRAAYSVYPPVVLTTTEPVPAGSELFTSYGGADWFQDRDIPFSESTSGDPQAAARRMLSDLKKEGHCLADVEVGKSSIHNAGRGLFARRAFSAGEMVSLSPALVLSKQRLRDAAPHSVAINYAISSEGSDIAILPFGRGVMANNGGVNGSNVRLKWYDSETPAAGLSRLNADVHALQQSNVAPLYVSYVATRDIAAGEELTLFYGHMWEQEWARYAKKMNSALDTGVTSSSVSRSIVFRQPIGAPEGMFPSRWFSIKDASSPTDEIVNDL